MAYIANTPDDVRVMLGALGLESLDQLFDMIPPEYRLQRPLVGRFRPGVAVGHLLVRRLRAAAVVAPLVLHRDAAIGNLVVH